MADSEVKEHMEKLAGNIRSDFLAGFDTDTPDKIRLNMSPAYMQDCINDLKAGVKNLFEQVRDIRELRYDNHQQIGCVEARVDKLATGLINAGLLQSALDSIEIRIDILESHLSDIHPQFFTVRQSDDDPDPILISQSGIDNIIERVEKLEGYMEMEDRVTASDVLLRLTQLEEHTGFEGLTKHELPNAKEFVERVEALEKSHYHNANAFYARLDKLETMQRDMLNAPNLIWAKYNKTPYCCPVCNGEAKTQVLYTKNAMVLEPFEKRITDSEGRHFILCHACDGKGVLWG